ncbi:hypothetical protein Tco_0198885 [Tanacetum coccineum]
MAGDGVAIPCVGVISYKRRRQDIQDDVRTHKGCRNTIELPDGNDVVRLRSDTIWLVQNGCLFHRLRSENPNQHLKDFLKLVDSLDLDVANRERTRLHLFQLSFRDQHQGGSLSEAWTLDLLQKSAGGKLRDRNTEESWALLEDLALYDNESWNNPRDFSKPVTEISLPHGVPSTSELHLTEIENQVQRLMEAHLAPKQLVHVNKIAFSRMICSGPHDTQYCIENPEQAFVDCASSHTNEAKDARLSKFEADFKQQQGDMTNKIDTVLKAINDRITGALPSDTVKNLILTSFVCSFLPNK